jgi:hypothetical protein
MTSASGSNRDNDLRAEITRSLVPVRPLPPPSRRLWMMLPLGLLVAVTTPLVSGIRVDLASQSPWLTWGLTALQALVGMWILGLALRESVPGENLSRPALAVAGLVSLVLMLGVTLVTNTLSPTVIPPGREFIFWIECVIGPMVLGVPFMLVATLLAMRAFPTRPAVTGALCGLSAGILSDAGWRLGCFVSSPDHVINSHDLAILLLAASGSLLAVIADSRRWR